MKRQFCQVKHDPENGTYGDCLRAVVATYLGHDVPHFFEDGCDGETGIKRLRDYLFGESLTPVMFSIPGEITKQGVFEYMAVQNPNVTYFLFCQCGEGDHVVLCKEDKVLFNPAWTPYPVSGPNSQNVWVVMVLSRL